MLFCEKLEDVFDLATVPYQDQMVVVLDKICVLKWGKDFGIFKQDCAIDGLHSSHLLEGLGRGA